ncbi:c-type cytochrome [Methylobacterium oxalidis]|uniref:c-type cytochrome n=1 Tax=Methylobacterium oxalidis TaxID=944322 RepID=UPI003314B7A4
MRSRKLGLAFAGGLALSLCALTVHAADLNARPDVRLGKPISEADLALWNIDIHTPTGGNLPPGEGTVAVGKAVYEAKCLACHGEAAAGGPMYGAMVGGIGTMDKNPRVLTPGSMYPFAPILFDYVRRAMPLDQPQSLTPDEVYSVAAYIYHLNGLVPEDFKMNAATMPTIKMPNQGNFIPDDRPDVRTERCMTDCKPIGTVADAKPRPPGNADTVGRSGGTGGQVIMGTGNDAGPNSKPQ